jgi:predicted secreted Zn-dependent protease
VIVSARFALALTLALSFSIGCGDETDPPAGAGNRAGAGTGGSSVSGEGGNGALGGASASGASGSSGAGRGGAAGASGGAAGASGGAAGASGGAAGASTSGGAPGGNGGSASGSGGGAGDVGASGGVSGASGASSEGGAGGDGQGGSSEGSAGAGGDHGSSCANPTTTIDTSNLTVDEAVETYSVTGSTANEIRQSINANRDGDYDAFTSWYLTWQYANDACDGSGLVVLVEIEYSLPEWDAPPAADPALTDEWSTYMDALLCHEYGHAEFGLDAANDVYATLSAIDAGGDCAAQQTQADAAFQSILDDYIAREIAYDEETNHGATMGAVFPQP